MGYLDHQLARGSFNADISAQEYVHVKNLHPPQFDDDMISHLVMSEQRLKTLKALSKSYARVNKHGEGMKNSKWSADFVRGKGNGLVFLLHGKPGVGKTCTAGKYNSVSHMIVFVLQVKRENNVG